jgi:hypothetical protein
MDADHQWLKQARMSPAPVKNASGQMTRLDDLPGACQKPVALSVERPQTFGSPNRAMSSLFSPFKSPRVACLLLGALLALIPTASEARILRHLDKDGDGIPNYRDPDIDGDGRFNWQDEDMDGDTLRNDSTVSGIIDPDIDDDGATDDDPADRDIDCDFKNNRTHIEKDIDSDGRPDDASDETDIDGDGSLNTDDADMDADTLRNTKDRNMDGDDVVNGRDGELDTDADGLINSEDFDDDGDGKLDINDRDDDADGDPDYRDTTWFRDATNGGSGTVAPETENPGVNPLSASSSFAPFRTRATR